MVGGVRERTRDGVSQEWRQGDMGLKLDSGGMGSQGHVGKH